MTGSNDEALAISEVEIGVEWRRCTRLGEVHVRGGYEGQLWHNAGGPFNEVLDLGLEGFSIGVALMR